MKNRYTTGHKGFLTLLENDWDKMLLDDLKSEHIKDEIKLINCIHQRKYKGNIRCSLDWNPCNNFNCKNYRKTDRPIKNIGN